MRSKWKSGKGYRNRKSDTEEEVVGVIEIAKESPKKK